MNRAVDVEPQSEKTPRWKVILDLLAETNQLLLKRIGRLMMNYLFRRNVPQMKEMMQQLLIRDEEDFETGAAYGENQPMERINYAALERFIDDVFQVAAEELEDEEINSMLSIWIKSESTRFLSVTAERRDVRLGELAESLQRFAMLPESQKSLGHEECIGIKVALIRRLLTEDLHYINTMKSHVSVDDFVDVLSRTIGPVAGTGKLGGKSAGLFRARQILESRRGDHVVLRNLRVPKTWYITSDAIIEFIHHNALEELLAIKYSDPSEIRQEHIYLKQIFKNSLLPTEILAGLSVALDDMGDVPLVVRSSSLLEDSTGAAFAGKYRSLFVANQGSKRERLEALVDAVLEVYASVFGPDPIEYRRERGLLDFNEEMGILIQEVVGHRLGDYYFPAYAGVAFSQNDFRWSPRIRREDGIIRLVTGLGTRAVDRVGDDFPVLVSPGRPGLRPNATVDETIRHAQKSLDVINLKTRRFETVSFQDLFEKFGSDYPTLSYIISLEKGGQLQPPMGTLFNVERERPVVTFERLISNSPFILLMKTVLDTLQEEIGMPVDVEFAYADDIQVPYLLQCRPQSHGAAGLEVEFPRDVPEENILFTADRYVTTGEVRGIEYLVYVDPLEYDLLDSREKLVNVGRVIGQINERLPQKRFVLMGPGRWGSRGDIKMGVQVGYSDINRTAILIEIARSKKGYVPDLSFGTHFFQDLVEAGIRYLPLYPDSEGAEFNEDFFESAHNCLPKMVPGGKDLAHVVKVIRVEREVSDATVTVLMDGDTERALAYLDRG